MTPAPLQTADPLTPHEIAEREHWQRFYLAKLNMICADSEWVNAPSPSYDAADLRAEYRERHYSPEAVAMIEQFDAEVVGRVRKGAA